MIMCYVSCQMLSTRIPATTYLADAKAIRGIIPKACIDAASSGVLSSDKTTVTDCVTERQSVFCVQPGDHASQGRLDSGRDQHDVCFRRGAVRKCDDGPVRRVLRRRDCDRSFIKMCVCWVKVLDKCVQKCSSVESLVRETSKAMDIFSPMDGSAVFFGWSLWLFALMRPLDRKHRVLLTVNMCSWPSTPETKRKPRMLGRPGSAVLARISS